MDENNKNQQPEEFLDADSMRHMDSGVPEPGHRVAMATSYSFCDENSFQSWTFRSILSKPISSADLLSLSSMRGEVSRHVILLTRGAISNEYVPGPDPISSTESSGFMMPWFRRCLTILRGISPCWNPEYCDA